MRGKARVASPADAEIRITPAYAGKSRLSDIDRSFAAGSPPPMRGKDGHVSSSFLSLGITPAYAGKSFR